MRFWATLGATLGAALLCATQGAAFCGFYVARADGSLYNEASTVVFARDGRTSTITMSSDYRGPASEFALIVPAPVVLQQDQVHTVDAATVAHLDAYTAPRLVEYFDWDPCGDPGGIGAEFLEAPVTVTEPAGPRQPTARDLGVRVEAQFAVDAYDIVILSAEESDGLVTWLRQEGYQIPDGAEGVLDDYINMGMKFFVARVNLERHSASATQELAPLQISFESRDFMLPLQLGKINSAGVQDMIMLFLSREGRVGVENYRNVWLPTDYEVPVFVEQVFGQFYRDMFAHTIAPESVVTEYAWDMAWCDPCAADPLTAVELTSLGATWVRDGVAPEAFVTRMHVQYAADTFTSDLMFRVTPDRANFQGRYVMNHPFEGDVSCEAGRDYVAEVRARIRKEASTVIGLTGWSEQSVLRNIAATVPARYR